MLRIKVKYADGREVTVDTKPADTVAFERQFDMSVGEFLTNRRYEWLAYFAWSPLRRGGQETATFDAFIESIEELELVDEEPSTPAPLAPAPTEEPSPS